MSYPAGTGYPTLAGTTAEIDAQQLGVVFRYEFDSGFSGFAGLRAVDAEGTASIPGVAGYGLSAEATTELGYLVGAAFERPDIALRVSLTYQSETDHTFTGTETGAGPFAGATNFQTTLPQSLTLEAQSGIAEGTLVFGSVRWVDWSEFRVAPTNFTAAAGGALADNSQDVTTYRAGLARRFSDQWVGLASVTYEPNGTGSTSGDAVQGNLDPRDGRLGLGLGARWEGESGLRISGGLEYIWFGDAVTDRVGAPGTRQGSFNNNTGYAAALRIGYSF